ncbi:MAG: hypothetical protein E7420_04035 [Ruminococcaceae bacterium]|nr:hypothetical protein [Oscillospiraceae bacterium]
MSKTRYAILAALIALWVTVFVFAESFIGGLLGIDHPEYWPALMGPSLIGLLGKEVKKAEKTFYITAGFGILMALVFVLLEHGLGAVMGATPGVLTALFIAVFVLIAGQFFFSSISGPISFVYFNAATILTFDIKGGLIQALVRFIILFVGTFVFIKVEHWLIHVVAPKKKAEK